MFIPSFNDVGGWATTGLFGVLGAFGVWLRLNKTQTEVTKTKTEGGWITQLVKDRDDSQKREQAAYEREKELNVKYQELKNENSVLRMQAILRDEKIDNLYKRVEMLVQLIIEFRPDLESFLHSSAFGDLRSSPSSTRLKKPFTDIEE